MNYVFAVAAVLIFVAITFAAVAEHRNWQEFKATHECRVVSRSTPSTAVGVDGSGGLTVATIEGKTGWLCNDGVTYYR